MVVTVFGMDSGMERDFLGATGRVHIVYIVFTYLAITRDEFVSKSHFSFPALREQRWGDPSDWLVS